jgi:hypothetical protein
MQLGEVEIASWQLKNATKQSPLDHYQDRRLVLIAIRLRGPQISHQMAQHGQFRLQPHHMLKDMAG